MIESTVSAAGMRIIKLLVGNPPRSVAELIDATKVTRTAVTEQLNELVAGGYIERKTERLPGRGRPRHLYKTTEAALFLLFADNQQLVMPAFWKAIEDVGGDEFKHKMLRKFCKILAEHYNRRIAARKPEERVRQFVDLLRSEGHIVESESNGQLMVFKRSCPFISIADRKRSVCIVDQEMMSFIVGRSVRRIDCRHEGAPCCSFEISTSKG